MTSPFPLEGGRAGDGGEGAAVSETPARGAASLATRAPSASTPTQPSPLEGEGSRFARDRKTRPASVARARLMRAEPTYTEAALWDRLRALPVRFRRQAPIGRYVVDFACHRARLAVEVDGGVHQRDVVVLRDAERDAWLTAEGYRVLRFTTKQIEGDIDAVVGRIEDAVRVSLPNLHRPATTPSQPFPLEGKGDSGF